MLTELVFYRLSPFGNSETVDLDFHVAGFLSTCICSTEVIRGDRFLSTLMFFFPPNTPVYDMVGASSCMWHPVVTYIEVTASCATFTLIWCPLRKESDQLPHVY